MMKPSLRAFVEAVLRWIVVPVLPARWVDRLVGFPLDAKLASWGLPDEFRRSLRFLIVRDWLEARLWRTAETRRLLAACDGVRGELVYVAGQTYPDAANEALALAKVFPGGGALVVLASDVMGRSVCEDAFEKVLDVRGNLYLLARVLGRLRFRFAVFRNTGGTLAAAPVFLAGCRVPFVYRPSGFMNQTDPAAQGELYGETRELRLRLERALLERAALVVHNHEADAIRYLRELLGVSHVEHLSVSAGVHRELAERHARSGYVPGAEISVAYCAGYVPPMDRVNRHADYLTYWKLLADGGVHVHVYYSHFRRDDPRLSVVRDALGGHPYFHLHDPLPFLELFETLQGYDYLWAYFAAPNKALAEPFRRFIGAATCVGLCAGVPIIVNEYNEPLYSFVEARWNGLALRPGLGAEVVEILKRVDRDKARRAALEVRERFYFPDRALTERLRALGFGQV